MMVEDINAAKLLESLDTSEFWDVNSDFAVKLTNESDRGAILIGGAKIDEYLERLIHAFLPSKEKSFTSRLFNYPGPLSSFSGKIELSYAFRLIDLDLYNCLNALRKIRNDAAHSSSNFTLAAVKEKVESIYDIEEEFPKVVHHLAYGHLVKWKLHQIKSALEKENLHEFNHEELWKERVPDPDKDEVFQEQLTIWKLSYGLTFLCIKIGLLSKYYSAIKHNQTLESLLKPL